MKKIFCTLSLFCLCANLQAQDNISDILVAGVDAANLYLDDYATPAVESLTYNIASGWYDDARVLRPGKFKIQVKAQATFSPDDKKSFLFDPTIYSDIIQQSYDATNGPAAVINVTFDDGSTASRMVATALGENDSPQRLIVSSVDPSTGALIQSDEIELAQGLSSEGFEFIPTAFLQAGVGIGAGLEIKARLVPKVEVDGFESGFWGAGLQWELSKLFEKKGEDGVKKQSPVALSLLMGYSRMDASYEFEDGTIVDGSNQSVESEIKAFNASLIAGTNWKVFNLFGGINYISGSTKTQLLGDYRLTANTVLFPINTTITDPVNLESESSGLLTTLGAKLSLGAFNIQADYTLGAYNTASASLFIRI